MYVYTYVYICMRLHIFRKYMYSYIHCLHMCRFLRYWATNSWVTNLQAHIYVYIYINIYVHCLHMCRFLWYRATNFWVSYILKRMYLFIYCLHLCRFLRYRATHFWVTYISKNHIRIYMYFAYTCADPFDIEPWTRESRTCRFIYIYIYVFTYINIYMYVVCTCAASSDVQKQMLIFMNLRVRDSIVRDSTYASMCGILRYVASHRVYVCVCLYLWTFEFVIPHIIEDVASLPAHVCVCLYLWICEFVTQEVMTLPMLQCVASFDMWHRCLRMCVCVYIYELASSWLKSSWLSLCFNVWHPLICGIVACACVCVYIYEPASSWLHVSFNVWLRCLCMWVCLYIYEFASSWLKGSWL